MNTHYLDMVVLIGHLNFGSQIQNSYYKGGGKNNFNVHINDSIVCVGPHTLVCKQFDTHTKLYPTI